MSGGIIIQRAQVLVTAANDPSFYANLPVPCKDAVDAITAKDPASRTQEDVNCLLVMLAVGAHS